ncbi:biopolymer transporter ExbD [Thalassotalea sp. M1531]|uniref:Biopolymer transporter ExbD n=1 Tax=Thalassotalea algicola TaxID=2716224 RepID=A0A7Y0Q5X5_9GAMM|nr:biopolymer transporter ExbD [Thalassotalea algicola]NMP30576.1 biopolymer transporter ExbD [Thalassotalea algicola]
MKQSSRAKRRERHHKRFKAGSKLNLVALMDIFTILVFFLIVNQSEVRVLQNIESINLPVSIAEELPVENVVITVLDDTVLVQERAVWQKSVSGNELASEDLSQESGEFIAALTAELNYQASKRVELTEMELEKGRAVTIIGDSSIPYTILKQIMAACADTGFRNISLAVEQKVQSSVNIGSGG